MRIIIGILSAGVLLGCATSEDPADGGFISGVSALAKGTYEARIDEREAAVTEGTQTQLALQSELAGLQGEYDTAKLELVRLRSELAANRVNVSQEVNDQVNTALATPPGGDTDAEKIAALKQAIADARALTDTLRGLSG